MIRAIPIAAAAAADAPVEALSMTEVEFRELYAQTARPLKCYLARVTGNATLADDLLQESYYRLLRARLPEMDRAQRKNYLYRIATNLARDHHRAARLRPASLDEASTREAQESPRDLPADIRKTFAELQPRERELMWLAYVEGASHREIAAVTGWKEASVRPLLFRARQKLAALLRERGFGKETGR